MAAKRASKTAKTKRVFGQPQAPAEMFRVGLYARVSTHDQQTLSLQMRALREYAAQRGWTIAVQIKEVGSGAAERELREKLLAAARRREIDVVLVWRLDRWPVTRRSGRYVKRTGGAWCRFRIAHGSTRSDNADRPRDGGTAVGLRCL
jgi:predicted site-specific integrase-resolvase